MSTQLFLKLQEQGALFVYKTHFELKGTDLAICSEYTRKVEKFETLEKCEEYFTKAAGEILSEMLEKIHNLKHDYEDLLDMNTTVGTGTGMIKPCRD